MHVTVFRRVTVALSIVLVAGIVAAGGLIESAPAIAAGTGSIDNAPGLLPPRGCADEVGNRPVLSSTTPTYRPNTNGQWFEECWYPGFYTLRNLTPEVWLFDPLSSGVGADSLEHEAGEPPRFELLREMSAPDAARDVIAPGEEVILPLTASRFIVSEDTVETALWVTLRTASNALSTVSGVGVGKSLLSATVDESSVVGKPLNSCYSAVTSASESASTIVGESRDDAGDALVSGVETGLRTSACEDELAHR